MPDAKVTKPLHIVLSINEGDFGNGCRSNDKTDTNSAPYLSWGEIVDAFMQKGTKFLTMSILSDDSPQPRKAIQHKMDLLIKSIEMEIGMQDKFIIETPTLNLEEEPNRSTIEISMRNTTIEENSSLSLNIILFDDGKTEIMNTIKKFVQNRTPKSSITEEFFRASLPYKDLPNPDMIVTVGSIISLNNPFLWQSAYSELHSISTKWNQIVRGEINNIFETFRGRKRRFGGLH